MQAEDDGVLVDRARRGDAAAFEGLVRRHDRAVLGVALRWCGSREDARDIYQETFLRAYRALAEFRGECSFRTWVLRIAAHVCMDGRRRSAVRPETPGGADGAAHAGGVAGRTPLRSDPHDPRPDGDPERALAVSEIRGRIGAALAGLSPRERMVFDLRHVQGTPVAEAARVLETSEETVRNCLYRAHRRLRAALADLAPAGRASATRAARAGDPAEAE